MIKEDQIKNIVAFFCIIFGETDLWHEVIMGFSPDYLIEKFNRYILSSRNEHDWGLHPSLRRQLFNRYCEKHKLEITEWNKE